MSDNSAEWAAYFAKLGRFYHAYTDLEHQLTCGVTLVVTEGREHGPAYNTAIAVLGGMRMSPLKDTTKRLLRILRVPQERKEAVDTIFAHLGDIQFLRDRLAHHMTRQIEERPGVWINDDYAAIREFDKSKKLEFELSALDAATSDLEIIKMLVDGIYTDYLTAPPGVAFRVFPEKLPSWQYKPSMLSPLRRSDDDSPK